MQKILWSFLAILPSPTSKSFKFGHEGEEMMTEFSFLGKLSIQFPISFETAYENSLDFGFRKMNKAGVCEEYDEI